MEANKIEADNTEADKTEADNMETDIRKKAKIQLRILFIVRICLWVVAFAFTAYWIWYSFKLTYDGVFEPSEYATLLRPVLYRNFLISVGAVALSFILFFISRKIKDRFHGFI